MGLTEREQKMLDELERSLQEGQVGDPARKLSFAEVSAGRIVFGILTLLAGLATVVAGVATRTTWLGVTGFVVMLTGVYLAASTKSAK